MKEKQSRLAAPSQSAAFKRAARELGCDPNEAHFQDALRKVAKAKPQLQTKKPKS
jgi:hypothetical protein